MSREWTAVGGYEVAAGEYGVSISNHQDDSSGATQLSAEKAFTLVRVLTEAACHALEERARAEGRLT